MSNQELFIHSFSRSKSVPRPPFTLFTPPSSSESNKRVPMNKIVLQPTRPKINLKNIKPKINTMENANYKVNYFIFISLNDPSCKCKCYLNVAWIEENYMTF